MGPANCGGEVLRRRQHSRTGRASATAAFPRVSSSSGRPPRSGSLASAASGECIRGLLFMHRIPVEPGHPLPACEIPRNLHAWILSRSAACHSVAAMSARAQLPQTSANNTIAATGSPSRSRFIFPCLLRSHPELRKEVPRLENPDHPDRDEYDADPGGLVAAIADETVNREASRDHTSPAGRKRGGPPRRDMRMAGTGHQTRARISAREHFGQPGRMPSASRGVFRSNIGRRGCLPCRPTRGTSVPLRAQPSGSVCQVPSFRLI